MSQKLFRFGYTYKMTFNYAAVVWQRIHNVKDRITKADTFGRYS